MFEHSRTFNIMGNSEAIIGIRRSMAYEINSAPKNREQLEAKHGQVWSADEVAAEFEIVVFATPFAVVTRKADGKKGSLTFQDSPRLYWDFQEAQ